MSPGDAESITDDGKGGAAAQDGAGPTQSTGRPPTLSEVPASVLARCQRWLLDSEVPFREQPDELRGNLEGWKEARLTCKAWAGAFSLKDLTGDEGAEWTGQMFTRRSLTCFVARHPPSSREFGVDVFAGMLKKLQPLPAGRVKLEFTQPVSPELARETIEQVGIEGLVVVSPGQHLPPSILDRLHTADCMSVQGAIQLAEHRGEFPKLQVLGAWLGGRRGEAGSRHMTPGPVNLERILSPFPGLRRLSLCTSTCSEITEWKVLRSLRQLRELRLDFFGCTEAKLPDARLLSGNAIGKLERLTLTRVRPGMGFSFLEGREAGLRELEILFPLPTALSEMDLTALGGVRIGRVTIDGSLTREEITLWQNRFRGSVAASTQVLCIGAED